MAERNRVTPFGEIVAIQQRGLFMGQPREHPPRPHNRPLVAGSSVDHVRARVQRMFAVTEPSVPILLVAFVLAGVRIGCVETAEHAAVPVTAPVRIRGSAFGLLAAVQSFGNLVASAIAGLIWTVLSPEAAFAYIAGWMLVALSGLATSR